MGLDENDRAALFDHVVTTPGACLAVADSPPDPYPYPGEDQSAVLSPCDGSPLGHGGLEGFYLLPSLMANPGVTDPLVTGLAPYLRVEAVNVSCPINAFDPGCANTGTILDVSEGTVGYQASWKTVKNGSASRKMVPESAWRLKVWLTDGSSDIRLLGYRDVIISDSPSTDQPSSDPALVIQIGSNQNVSFWITQDMDTCLTSDDYSITCLIGDGGGSLNVTGPSGTSTLTIGEGNGTNIFTLRMEDCESDLDVDVPLIGCRVDVESPSLARDAILAGSSIEICEVLDFGDANITSAYVLKVDDEGQTVLPPTSFSCPASLTQAAPSGIRGVLARGLTRVASVFGAKPLVATATVGSVSGGGGRLRDLSGFQLAVLPVARKLSGDGATVPAGGSVTVQVATDSWGTATPYTTIHFKPDPATDPTGTTACPASFAADASCDDSAGYAVFTTGADGQASAVWTPRGTGTMKLMALGCGVAVEGSDTPTTAAGFVLGNPLPDGLDEGVAHCDRDPADLDNGSSGYANGPRTGLDPFETKDDSGFIDYEVAYNDLPLVFTARSCSINVNGEKEAAWDECAEETITFPVNLPGGGRNSGATATFRWLNTPTDLILSLEVPRNSDEASTSLWAEFNAGAGFAGETGEADANADGPDEFDDLIGVERSQGVSVSSDRYLDATCASSSGSSVCNAIDGTNDVVAGVGFDEDGQFIFYEISHPLDTGEEGGFDLQLQSGDWVGLFLRLAVGNGAQGKTIWRGFRDYHVIQIQ